MTPWEWAGWMAFAELEPFGPRQDDYRAAMAAIVPAQAMNGQRIDPGVLFASLASTGPPGAKKAVGRNFRLFAVANCPAIAAVSADRMRAE